MTELVPLALERLRRSANAIEALVAGLPIETVRWKPAPERWSMLEVICHLGDEEVEDFGARTRGALLEPGKPWPPIEPSRWVTERRYAEQGLGPSLARFLGERATSLQWLAMQREANWDSAYQHPKVGPVSARLLVTNWMAHDLLHIKQLVRLQYDALAARGEKMDYAGPWT